jgi:hypothetical protein
MSQRAIRQMITHRLVALRRATRWHVQSQEVARRNAMLASTVLTQRRVERQEVEEFLTAYLTQRAGGPALAERVG